jgi:guanylate kinase
MSLILTLTGMSTSGKSTLAKALTATGAYAEAVSVTTRAMRPGEVDGVDYRFVTPDEFEGMVNTGQLLEHVRSHHACYGVPASEIKRIKDEGKSVVMVLEPEGVSSIHRIAMEQNQNFLCAFVHVGMQTLMQRFFTRIDQSIVAGKEVNYDQEAKRLHVMLSKERAWSGRFEWDMTFLSLHEGDNLARTIDQLIGMHTNSSDLKPVPRTLKPGVELECMAQPVLAKMIRSQVENPQDLATFYRFAMSPMILKQDRIRYVDGSPTPA